MDEADRIGSQLAVASSQFPFTAASSQPPAACSQSLSTEWLAAGGWRLGALGSPYDSRNVEEVMPL
jgi:hypothetical protein